MTTGFTGCGRLALSLIIASCLSFAPAAHAAGAPAPFFTVDGTVHSTVVSGDRLYVGGEFDSVIDPVNGPTPARNLVAIDLSTGTILWDGGITGAVYALAVSSTVPPVLYVGGDFDEIRGVQRDNLAAVNANTGNPVNAWTDAPRPDAPVRALARTQDGLSLYVGGDFTMLGDAEPRRHIASVSPTNGTVLPWDPDADQPVLALAVDGASARVFAGGLFTTIGGESRNRLAAIGITTARPLSWDPGLTGNAVHALLYAGDRLYVGGDFTMLAEAPRVNLGSFNVPGSAITPGALDADVTGGPVRALALDAEALRLYLGGAFSAVDADDIVLPRNRLAAIGLGPDGEAARLLAWDPGADLDVHALSIADDEWLYAGGAFTEVDGEAAAGLASLPVARPVTVADPPGGGYRQEALMEGVTLSCEAGPGIGCFRICAIGEPEPGEPEPGEPEPGEPGEPSEPSEPRIDEDCFETLPVDMQIPPEEITILRFFSEDNDGNREALRTERYAIDDEAPVTVVQLPPLPDGEWYNATTLSPLVMTCKDNHVDFGCATHYTLNGSEPGTDSALYDRPVSLATLLPPPSTPLEDIDMRSGTFTVRLFSIDDAGNEEEIQDLVYRIDLAAPVVTPSLPSGTYVAPLTLVLECDDGTGSGCENMYYTTNNRPPSDGTVLDGNDNPIPATARYEGPLTLTEATILRVHAVDRAGNASSQSLGIYALSAPSRETRSGVGSMDGWLLTALLGLGLLRREGWRGNRGNQIKEARPL